MDSLLIGDDIRTVRPTSESRKAAVKSARFKPSVVKPSKSDSSLKMHWKSGVMNLSFSSDDDYAHSKSLTDSPYDEVFSPVTSPKSDYLQGLYHKAVSRRQPRMVDDLVEELPPCVLTTNGNATFPIVTHKMETQSTTETNCHLKADTDRLGSSIYRTSPSVQTGEGMASRMTTSIGEEENHCRSRHSEKQGSQISMRKARSQVDREMDKTVLMKCDENAELTVHPSSESKDESRFSKQKIDTNFPDQNRSDSLTNSPERKRPGRPRSPGTNQKASDYQAGIEAVIGDSVPLSPISDSQSEVEGVETSFGPDTEMSEVVETRYTSGSTSAAYNAAESPDHMKTPAPSAGRRRKSLRAFFRVGLFTAKAKSKSTTNDDTPLSELSSPPPTNRRLVQRRVSRLEMNEPIEDIFSEVTFKTMDNRSASYDDTHDEDGSDCDEVEDPDVILQSYMNGQIVEDEETFVFKGVDDASSHENDDVIDPKESELLLPGQVCCRSDTNEEPLTSETDLR